MSILRFIVCVIITAIVTTLIILAFDIQNPALGFFIGFLCGIVSTSVGIFTSK